MLPPSHAHFRSLAPFALGLLLALLRGSGFAEPPARRTGGAAEPLLPRTLCVAGANEEARFDPWIVDPPDFSGHYVSESVTDGWVELRVTIHSPGARGGVSHWVADVLERDSRRGPGQEEREFRNLSVEERPQPYVRLEEGGPALFFLQRKVGGPKGLALRPAIVSATGDCYRFEPRIPKSVVLAGHEMPVDLRPWKAPKPSAYEGRYLAITALDGAAIEIDLTTKPHPGSRLPWSLDASVTFHTSGKEDTAYDYTNRPLWEGEWPHFDATEAYAFVYFTDPRTPGAKAAPALITARGNVLAKAAKP